MKRSAFIIAIALFFSVFVPSFSNAAPKSGAVCTSKGKVQIYKGYKYTCVKKSGKLVWSKGPAQEVKSQPPTNPAVDSSINYLYGVYDKDPNPPAEWKQYQDFITSNAYHTGPLRYVEKLLGSSKPVSSVYQKTVRSDISLCKPKQIHNYPILGFVSPEDSSKINFNPHPSPTTKFQVVPVQWREYEGKGTPNQDYGKYFRFVENWIRNNSDNGSTVEIKIPEKYFTLPKGINQYSGINTHGQPTDGGRAFFADAIASVDPYIDFSGVDIVLLVVPPNTPIRYLGNQPWSSNPRSAEGPIRSILTNPPHDLTTWHINHQLGIPGAWIHEIWHAGRDLGDHGGVGAMGSWGVMSSMGMDLMGWEKYVAGFMSDKQIICAATTGKYEYWIVPSTIKGDYEKLLVLPVNETRVVVIESMRSYGYNYKLGRESQGALVYIIDTSRNGYHEGEHVVVPAGRSFDGYMDAPLKQGESITVEGYTISIVEAGLFGEVVRVEKA